VIVASLLAADPTMYPLVHAIERRAIMDDLREVFHDWKEAADHFQQDSAVRQLPARVEGGVLYYCDDSFRRGDEVVVISELTAQEFPGTFLGANSVEAGVLLPDGTGCRLPLAHLRFGRLVLHKAGVPDPSTVRLLESLREARFPPLPPGTTRPNSSVSGPLPPAAAEAAKAKRLEAVVLSRQAEAIAEDEAPTESPEVALPAVAESQPQPESGSEAAPTRAMKRPREEAEEAMTEQQQLPPQTEAAASSEVPPAKRVSSETEPEL
jgi:hypothetical protein